MSRLQRIQLSEPHVCISQINSSITTPHGWSDKVTRSLQLHQLSAHFRQRNRASFPQTSRGLASAPRVSRVLVIWLVSIWLSFAVTCPTTFHLLLRFHRTRRLSGSTSRYTYQCSCRQTNSDTLQPEGSSAQSCFLQAPHSGTELETFRLCFVSLKHRSHKYGAIGEATLPNCIHRLEGQTISCLHLQETFIPLVSGFLQK